MFRLLIFSFLLKSINASPKLDTKLKCCIDNPKRKNLDLVQANYDCSHLNYFGEDRCNSIFQGNVCKWGTCPSYGPCERKPFFELHYGKNIDVGMCGGFCKTDLDGNQKMKCSPSVFDIKNIKKKTVKIIKECQCQDCGVKEKIGAIKIPKGECVGVCQDRDLVCLSGVEDEYSQLNGIEVSSPSIDLINSAANICPLGIQNRFDTFIDNRCFIHTFQNCIRKSNCPIRTLNLDICIRAANVFLTNTDSLRLGTNGIGLWGISLPNLNGGSWNQGNQLCLTIDLSNLPNSGSSILNNVIIDGHLDVLVQDDTAVDFLRLTNVYENCEKCLPVEHRVHTFYSHNGLEEFRHIKDCDCLNLQKCTREKLEEVYFAGSLFEVAIDVGQCIGKCNTGGICNKESVIKKIKSPYGEYSVTIIEDCFC